MTTLSSLQLLARAIALADETANPLAPALAYVRDPTLACLFLMSIAMKQVASTVLSHSPRLKNDMATCLKRYAAQRPAAAPTISFPGATESKTLPASSAPASMCAAMAAT